MSPVLVPVEDAALWIGIQDTADENSQLGALIDAVETLLIDLTGATFAASGTVTDEPHNGTGTSVLWVDRPIATLTAVKIGRNLALPAVTLDVTDPDVIVIDPRSTRRLVRPLGAIFPKGVRNVFVSYDASDHRPRDAVAAVKEAVAFLWRRRGSEEAHVEKIGTYNRELNSALMRLPLWKAYIDAHAATMR